MLELPLHTCLSLGKIPMIDFMPVVGMLLLILWMVMMIRKRRRRNTTQPTAREQLERLRQREHTRDDLNQIMVDIEQMAKRVSAQLDAKAVELDRLLDRAERQAAELRRLKGEPQPPGTSGDPENPEYLVSHGMHDDDPSGELDALPRDAGDNAQGDSSGHTPHGEMSSTDFRSDDPLTRSVYQLADAGLASTDIASRLNEHVGKVELILALRNS